MPKITPRYYRKGIKNEWILLNIEELRRIKLTNPNRHGILLIQFARLIYHNKFRSGLVLDATLCGNKREVEKLLCIKKGRYDKVMCLLNSVGYIERIEKGLYRINPDIIRIVDDEKIDELCMRYLDKEYYGKEGKKEDDYFNKPIKP